MRRWLTRFDSRLGPGHVAGMSVLLMMVAGGQTFGVVDSEPVVGPAWVMLVAGVLGFGYSLLVVKYPRYR